MTARLDPPVRVGPHAVAAIVDQSVGRIGPAGGAIIGSKRPLAILLRSGGRTRAFAPDGAPIALADLDRLYPGLRTRFEAEAG